jgi:His-Xaa-Ser system protein HxsD
MSTTAREIVVELDTRVYRLGAIKKAAYRFGDRCHVRVEPVPGGTGVRVVLRAKRVLDNPAFLAGEFQNDVLDQDLREMVAEETEAVRNLILAHAFSATSLLDADGDAADYHGDPLGTGTADTRATSGRGAAGGAE